MQESTTPSQHDPVEFHLGTNLGAKQSVQPQIRVHGDPVEEELAETTLDVEALQWPVHNIMLLALSALATEDFGVATTKTYK